MCSFCNDKGASISCASEYCQAKFHYLCALKNSCVFSTTSNKNSVYCNDCYIKQSLQKHIKYGYNLSPSIKPLVPLNLLFEKSLSFPSFFIPKMRLFVEKSGI